jgi:lipopolysaccharide export system permease protein
MIKKLDWYILKRFIGTFFFTILLLAVIACVIDWSEKSDDFFKNHVPAMQVLNYFKNFVPHISALLYPLFIFIACIFFTSKLAYKSEIIAMLATGVSFQRLMRSYIIGATLLGALALLANHIIVPMANRQRLAFEDRYVHEKRNTSDRNVHLQLSPTLLVYMQSYDYPSNTGMRFTAEQIKGTLLIEKLMAETASYDTVKKQWNLRNVTIRRNDSINETLIRVPDMVREYPFTPKDLRQDDDVKEALTTPQLNRYIALQSLHGNENLNFYYVERARRTAQPFAGFILSMIGVFIASRKIRGGSGLHLAIGIAISALYIMALQLTTTFSTKAGLNPTLAVWIPNIIFAIVALVLYRRQVR